MERLLYEFFVATYALHDALVAIHRTKDIIIDVTKVDGQLLVRVFESSSVNAAEDVCKQAEGEAGSLYKAEGIMA